MTPLQLTFRRLQGRSPPLPKWPIIFMIVSLFVYMVASRVKIKREWEAQIPVKQYFTTEAYSTAITFHNSNK